MQLIQDNTLTTIHFTEDPSTIEKVDTFLYDHLAADVKGAQFSPAFKHGQWDGKTHFYDKKTHSFATGLTKDVTTYLEKIRFDYEFTFTVVDNRPDKFIEADKLPDEITLGGLTLRDYQMDAVKAVFKNYGGIVNNTVSSGKTLVGATIVDIVRKHLNPGERIAFFTNNKEIFNQNIKNLSSFIPEKVGYLGGGKKQMARIMVVMIPTAESYLKVDPEAGLKFTPKERQIKKIAKTYAPQFINEEHPYQAFKSFVTLYQPIKKVDYTTKQTLEDIRDTVGNDKQLINKFNEYIDTYNELINEKAGDLVKKKQFITDLLDSFVLFVADECLDGDSLVSLKDGSYKRIKDIIVGDNVAVGGKVSHLKTVKSDTITLTHEFGAITATPTHPIAVLKDNKIVYKPVMAVKVGDKLLTKKPSNPQTDINGVLTTDEGRIAYMMGMLYADGSFLRAKNPNKHSNTVRVNISHKEQFSWYRRVFKQGIKALCQVHSINIDTVNIVDKFDIRGNLLLRVTNKDVAKVLYDTYELPFGKKSSIIKLPTPYMSSKELRLAFFSGVISCEGTVSKDTTKRVSIDMCSKRLINDLLVCLNDYGLHGYYFNRHNSHDNHSNVYRASFTTGHEWEHIIPADAPKHETVGRDYNKYYKAYGDYIITMVKTIEYGKEQTMYDLTTENHVFIADGLLNHNCHHSKADTWYRVLLSCNNAIYKVGLTGSIDREDPVTVNRLKGVFGGIVSRIKAKELIDKGLLAKPTVVMIPINEPQEVKALTTKGKGWEKIYKLGIEENQYRNTLIAGLAKKQYENDKSVLIIVNRINQAEIISSYLDALSIPHEFINGQQDDQERKDELARVATGENRVLLATSVLDEGVDISNIDTLIMAAGGKSMRQVIQRIGRVLRKKKNKENKATIFDFDDRQNPALKKHTRDRLAIYKEQEFEVKYVGN